MMGFLYLRIISVAIISVSTVIQASSENNKWMPLCQNKNGKLLLSYNNTSIFKIKENSKWKTFVTNFDPDNIKCLSLRKFKDKNEEKGEMRGFVNLKLVRPNAFNSEYTVTCKHSSGIICYAKFIVLEKSSKLEKECKINGTMSCDINRIEEERKYAGYKNLPERTTQKLTTTTTNELSYNISPHRKTTPINAFDAFGNWNFHPSTRIVWGNNEIPLENSSEPEQSEGSQDYDMKTTTVISVISPSLRPSETVKYSIYVNETVRK